MGRATVFLVGLVVILALMFGVVNMVLRANDGPSLSGDYNQVDPITQLVGSDAGGPGAGLGTPGEAEDADAGRRRASPASHPLVPSIPFALRRSRVS